MLPQEIFDHHTAIVGRTGSGKSFAARGIVEGWLTDNRRVCIVDPTDVWYGLRSNAAGDGPGHPVVIFGGEHADVPIGERSGQRIAEIIGSRNLPAVIVTAEMTGGERHRFMADFLGTLYRTNRTPLHLVLDEADDVAPQNPLPENRRMLGDVDKIVRRGRVRGFRVTMITQRPAVLHKNVLSQASTLIAMRLPAPQDRKALDDWIKGQADIEQAREVLASLSRLGRGEGWVWAPEDDVLERVTFPAIGTFDSMRTPEHGEAIGEPTSLASVELGDLRALLAEPETAGDTGGAGAPSSETIVAAERRGYEAGIAEGNRAGHLDALNDLIDRIKPIVTKGEALISAGNELATALRELAPGLATIEQPADAPERQIPAPTAAAPRQQPTPTVASPRRQRPSAPPSDGAGKITGPQQRILDAAAWWEAAGISAPTRAQIAWLASYSPSAGAFHNPLSTLRTAGLLDYPSPGTVVLTSAGRAVASSLGAAPTTAELHRRVYDRLSGPQRRILTPVITAYPGSISRDDLAAKAGYSPTAGAFHNPLSSLRTLGLVNYPDRGMVRAEPVLFIDQRPRAVRA